MRLQHSLRTVLAIAVTASTACLLVAAGDVARALGASCSAHMAGLTTSRKTPVELVVFNSTTTEMSLDLRLRDVAGDIVLERPGGVVVGPYKTAVVGLEAELSRDLAKKEKPFEGVVAIELTGDAPFAEDTAIVHATQYFGKTKRPRGAVIFRPLYRSDD